MFYLKTEYQGVTYWIAIKNGTFLCAEASALHAEAFKPTEVETIRQVVEHIWGCKCEPVECSTRTLIPAHLLPALNISE